MIRTKTFNEYKNSKISENLENENLPNSKENDIFSETLLDKIKKLEEPYKNAFRYSKNEQSKIIATEVKLVLDKIISLIKNPEKEIDYNTDFYSDRGF